MAEVMGKRMADRRAVANTVEAIDSLTLHVADVFGMLADMPDLGPGYADLLEKLERSMQQYVESADALTYRVQQDRERGRL